jgi:proteasome lid subunit RPN8/RPN11
MKVNKNLTLAMHKEAQLRYPEEACGFLINENNKIKFVACKNIDSTPLERFVIGTEDVASAEDRGEIISVWHSHPNGKSRMSDADVHSCDAFGVNWIVFGVTKIEDEFVFEEMKILEPSDYEITYIGRPYIYGVKDCFTLCCDYYKKEFGISLTFRAIGYPESRDWVDKEEDILGNNFEKCGFIDVSHQKIQIGDVLLIGITSSTANHIAIYSEEDTILHHVNNRLSSKEVYKSGYWVNNTIKVLRHKERV